MVRSWYTNVSRQHRPTGLLRERFPESVSFPSLFFACSGFLLNFELYAHRRPHQRGLHPDQHWLVKAGVRRTVAVKIAPGWLSRTDGSGREESQEMSVFRRLVLIHTSPHSTSYHEQQS
jgi:hypothetical protein